MEVTGVTPQKNSLGILVTVCGLALLWEWFERGEEVKASQSLRVSRFDRYLPFALFVLGGYLLYLCDSATSIVCLAIGGTILAAIKFPLLRQRISAIGGYTLAAGIAFYAIDSAFGIKKEFLALLGRDMTFTGRTDVWRELFELNTDPIIGTGFLSFWSDQSYRMRLPDWIAFSAHNGYIETYLDGGWIAIIFLSVMLVVTSFRINLRLKTGNTFALVRFCVLIATILGNFSESHYARMTPLWFMFLVCAIDPASLPKRSIPAGLEISCRECPELQQDRADLPPLPHLV
jgi:O-antigen ligase